MPAQCITLVAGGKLRIVTTLVAGSKAGMTLLIFALNIAAMRQNHLSVVSSRRKVCRRRRRASAEVMCPV
jgi:hypothetical protein